MFNLVRCIFQLMLFILRREGGVNFSLSLILPNLSHRDSNRLHKNLKKTRGFAQLPIS